MPKSKTDTNRLTNQIETLEERLAMTADPVSGFLGGEIEHHATEEPPALGHHIQQQVEATADFWRDAQAPVDLDEYLREIEQQLNSAHNTTGLNDVRDDYGFTGRGQTVAVIDSGIAYDHYALGGGLGSDYRVVGGWDFTGENDADPYDDGPSGSHGTHVAGIIGSTDSTHEGVAPGADLVGLRVFDDDGNGYFHWVEEALQWVHDHRNDFENPITAVNLSLGVSNWNSSAIPNWANLESEFAQLEADGIFVAVSAGNSYADFNTPGLSYPAASPYVIPVMSVDDSGSLSYYSQRHERAIAAPGRSIYSTVPDYKGNNNGTTDDFRSKSGTSMASPYVAGASVLVREAMEFTGMTGITQDTIFDHMIATADSFFDSATSSSYSRLNIQSAIDALMPDDDYGDSAGAAHDLGTISDTASVSGVISKLNDADFFSFTAGATGTVSFTASNMSHELAAQWTSSGGTTSGANGETLTLDVVAGQSYVVGFNTSDGLGYFDFDITSESTFTFSDWGVFSSGSKEDVNVAGEGWYRIEASQDGYMTVQSAFNTAGGNVTLELYNENMELIDTGDLRVDVLADAGDAFFIHAVGTNADVDFQMTNLVDLDNGVVTVNGTDGSDAFTFSADSTYYVTVNGVGYGFDLVEASNFVFEGAAGTDVATLYDGAENDVATFSVSQTTLSSNDYFVTVNSAEEVYLHSGGGFDQAIFYDSVGDDNYIGWSDRASYRGDGFRHDAIGYSNALVYSNSGSDHATFYDTIGDEWYIGRQDRVRFGGAGFHHDARDFESTLATSTGGADKVTFYDTSGDDVYVAWADRAIMAGEGYHNDTRGFSGTNAYATTGYDQVTFYDTSGDDTFVSWADRAIITGDGYYNDSRGFDSSRVFASGGNDNATFYDTVGDDNFIGRSNWATMMGTGYRSDAYNFDTYEATATTGYDQATFYDTAGNDRYIGYYNRAKMWGADYYHTVNSFNRTVAFSTTGDDQATFYDSAGNDNYVAWSDRTLMVGSGFYNDIRGFNRTTAFSSAGDDTALFYDSAGNDSFVSWSDRTLMAGTGYFNDARGFAQSQAYASGSGNDTAKLYDSAGNDQVSAAAWGAFLESSISRTEARGFDRVTAYCQNGGIDEATSEAALDYVFDLVGDWH